MVKVKITHICTCIWM